MVVSRLGVGILDWIRFFGVRISVDGVWGLWCGAFGFFGVCKHKIITLGKTAQKRHTQHIHTYVSRRRVGLTRRRTQFCSLTVEYKICSLTKNSHNLKPAISIMSYTFIVQYVTKKNIVRLLPHHHGIPRILKPT